MKKLLYAAAAVAAACVFAAGGLGRSIKNDRRFTVSALGFEKCGNQIGVTVEAIIINSESVEEKPRSAVFFAEDTTIDGALEKISAKLSRPMLFEHCGIIAVGDAMTDELFYEICEYCIYENRITVSAYIISTDSPKELLSGEPQASLAVGYDIMGIIARQAADGTFKSRSRCFEAVRSMACGNKPMLPRFIRGEDDAEYVCHT